MPIDLQARLSIVEALEPVRVYDRTDLDHFLAAAEAEAERLRTLIAAAAARRDELLASQPLSVTEQVGAIMLDAQAQLTEEWEACRRSDAALEDATEALSARILDEARARADALQTMADEIRASQAGSAHDVAEPWWNDVIDLTRTGQAEPAQSA